MDFSKAKELSINGQPVVMLQVGDVILWKKGGEREWKLDEDGALLGVDGKYYQRLYDDSEMVDNNPIPDLNSQWVVDTVSGALNIDKNFDYYMSNSNYHVSSAFAQFKVAWSGLESVTFLYRSYAESTCDYLVISALDKDKFTANPSTSTSGVVAHTSGKQTTTYSTIKIDTPDKGEHHIWFCYRKDGSVDSNSDRAFVGIPNNYKSGEIYEKQGEELRYEYLQSTDYVPSEREGYIRYKWYKTYFSPNNAHQFRTDDYILGEEVPATPITANYLRFDAVDNPVHIGFNDLSLVTDMEYSMTFEETFASFPADGVDIPQGKSIWLRASGLSSNTTYRTFTTSAPVECHGDVRSLLNKTNFTSAPLTFYCFNGLLKDTKITSAPELPATELAAYCYSRIFQGCTGLTSAPELPATTLIGNCYNNMFNGCTGLTSAPTLPATELADSCYYYMFSGCTGLTSAPELPATTLTGYCYGGMFYGCTGLTSAPELHSHVLTTGCYNRMFSSCSNLTTVPVIGAKDIANQSCDSMFQDCPKLNYIKVDFIKLSFSLVNWVKNVASSGTFVKYEGVDISTGVHGIPTGWTVEEIPLTPITANYLRFDAVNNDVYIGFNSLALVTDMEYSMGYEEGFIPYSSSVSIPQGKSVWFRASGLSTNNSERTFTTNAAVECHGDVRSLLRKTDFTSATLTPYCFYGLFKGSRITTAPELPATTLTEGCYCRMFYNCTSLVTVPSILPATTLASHCYREMFRSSSKITTAPDLPATTLVDHCYDTMFYECSTLNYVKAMFTTTPSITYTSNWLAWTSSTGTFVKNAAATWDVRGGTGIPNGWTVETAA